MGVDYAIEVGDVAQVRSDLLVLKYAQGFYGADDFVSSLLAERGVCAKADLRPEPGKLVIVETKGIIAPVRVMFVGVPPLRRFRYKEMRQLAQMTIEWAASSRIEI